MSSAPDLTSRVLGHERTIVGASVTVVAALAWLFVVAGAGMPADASMAAAPPFAALVGMWTVMMVAMMLPSAAPAILLYARVRQARNGDAVIAPSWVFAAGYLLVWIVSGMAFAFLQQLAIGPSIGVDGRTARAAVLLAAGFYQLSPLKSACLGQCRSPAQFISRHWRSGSGGAIRLGILHGTYCLGCCWCLMALLFVGGVMNLWWIVMLTLIVAVEKLAPAGAWIGRVAGLVFIAWGGVLLLL